MSTLTPRASLRLHTPTLHPPVVSITKGRVNPAVDEPIWLAIPIDLELIPERYASCASARP